MNFDSAKNILTSIHEKEFVGGVSQDVVDSAKKELGFNFPIDYVEYLTRLGCGFASSEDFIGLGGEHHIDLVHTYNRLRELTKHTQLPVNFIPLKSDGYGNYECIDVGNSSENKSLIVFWLHDGGDEQDCEMISNGFWEWFIQELKSIQEFDKEGN